jgi:hypothetical protein
MNIYYYKIGNGAKKMLIVGGQHGPTSDPRDGVLTLCRIISDFVNGKFPIDIDDILRSYTLIVIPILNVYGFDNSTDAYDGPGGRRNYNGVNLNGDWNGDSTQIEVISTKDLITSENPDIILDVHCTGTNRSASDDFTNGAFWYYLHNNSGFASCKDQLEKRYGIYSQPTDLSQRSETLAYYTIETLGKIGGLIETQYYIKGINNDSGWQVESANYNYLLNMILYLISQNNSTNYEYKVTNQQDNMLVLTN